MFLEIERNFLKQIATDSDRVPTLYYSNYWPVREVFWLRLKLIHHQIKKLVVNKQTCLDFGGGGGVFLPTLSQVFERVFFLDLEDREAQQVVAKYQLPNIKIIKQDIAVASIAPEFFDAIIAADVLEHFQDLEVPVQALSRWLKPNGILFTSLPTENWVYILLRKVFKITKPEDHYHTGYEVEAYLKTRGFQPVSQTFIPLYINLFPLFLVTAWKLEQPSQ